MQECAAIRQNTAARRRHCQPIVRAGRSQLTTRRAHEIITKFSFGARRLRSPLSLVSDRMYFGAGRPISRRLNFRCDYAGARGAATRLLAAGRRRHQWLLADKRIICRQRAKQSVIVSVASLGDSRLRTLCSPPVTVLAAAPCPV